MAVKICCRDSAWITLSSASFCHYLANAFTCAVMYIRSCFPLPTRFYVIFLLVTNVWNVTTKPSWVSKHRSDEERRGNGRKNCSFCFPWHAISILYPHLSKSHLKQIRFIFLGWMGLRGSPPDMARWQWGWKERMKMIMLSSCLKQWASCSTAD